MDRSVRNGRNIILAVLGGLYLCAGPAASATDGLAALTQKASAGDRQAQEDLGGIYIHGTGVPVDYAAARKWYALAAPQGSVKAQHNLCFLYGGGLGGDKDMAKAIAWCEKAASQGFVKSQVLLGDIYLSGNGVPVDNAAALKWYTLAAAQGDAHAQAGVAHIYANGVGVARDYDTALVWAMKSAAQGDASGIKLKADIEAAMAPTVASAGDMPAPPPPLREESGANLVVSSSSDWPPASGQSGGQSVAQSQVQSGANPYARENEVIRTINSERRSFDADLALAQSWESRGESKEACSYYQKAFSDLGNIAAAYDRLGLLTSDDANYATARDYKKQMEILRSNAQENCEAAGTRIY